MHNVIQIHAKSIIVQCFFKKDFNLSPLYSFGVCLPIDAANFQCDCDGTHHTGDRCETMLPAAAANFSRFFWHVVVFVTLLAHCLLYVLCFLFYDIFTVLKHHIVPLIMLSSALIRI